MLADGAPSSHRRGRGFLACADSYAVAASQDMARRLPDAEPFVFEDSARMAFAEEPDRSLAAIRQFLHRITS